MLRPLLCLVILFFTAAKGLASPPAEWRLWFAEYDTVSERADGQPALYFFKNRATFAAAGDDPSMVSRLESGSRSFDVYRQGDAYYADSMPLFAPSPKMTSIRGGEFDCNATAAGTGYAVTCRSNYSGVAVRSFYRPQSGIEWFEYFCGYPAKVCRFEFKAGQRLFRMEFLRTLEKRGDVKTDAPSRPRTTQ